MKYFKIPWLFLFSFSSIFLTCKKDNSTPINNSDQLPPATQTGANTFGCLVNGKVWVPKGFNGTGTPNPHTQYAIDLSGQPYLGIITNQFINSSSKGEILISFKNLTHLGSYEVPSNFDFSVAWPLQIPNCATVTFDPTLQKWGQGVITKLDIPNQIISGTFNFKYKTPSCDTVFITDGRFDIKF